jgi:hypothetical protein
VNLRLILSACGLATLGLLQAGCAGSPTTASVDMQPRTWDIGDRPQMAFPGATRAEVKSLAMGAARSRAWNIAESNDDRLVVQRPLDVGSPAMRDLGSTGATPGSLVEVTSYFVEDRGGVKVALDAALVSQVPSADKPTRTDVTETFRPSLDESLRSLHSTWSQNRARLARAAPPSGSTRDGGAAAATEQTASAQPDSAVPVTTAWSDRTVSAATEPPMPEPPAATAAPPVPSAPRSAAPPPEPRVESSARVATTPSPEPRRPPGGPAPVVDASPMMARTPSGPASQPMSLPDPTPATESIPAGENMMALYPSAGAVSWSYYAEQYARLRGCNVSPQGSILIDARSDGEIHKVPCEGADSVLVQCQNGECRGLL